MYIASALSLGITSLTESATVSCLVVPNPFLGDVWAAISTSAEFSTSGTDIVSGRDSTVVDVTRMRHYGRRNELVPPERNPTR